MNIELADRTTTEVRLNAGQVTALMEEPRTSGPQVVLHAEGLGSPRQWTAQLPTAADRIVVEYDVAGRPVERAWILSAVTSGTRYYTPEHDAAGTGYISR